MPNKMHPQGDTMMRRRTFLTTTAIILCAPSLISDVQAQPPSPQKLVAQFSALTESLSSAW